MRKHVLCIAALALSVAASALAGDLGSLPTASPESVGMSSERLARFSDVWKREIAAKSFGGCVTLLARDGKVVYYKSEGTMDANGTKEMPLDAIFCSASLTKPIVSVATMMLVEQGILKLSDPIGKHLKEFDGVDMQVETRVVDENGNESFILVPAERPITIYDLLRHTSGFAGAENAMPGVRQAYRDQNITAASGPISSEDMLSRLANIPLSYQPGTTFRYGISTDVLGLLLERVVGQRLEELLRDMVTGPLGMTSTSFKIAEANLHRAAEYPMSEPNRDNLIRSIAMNGSDGVSYYKGASGLHTTVYDYCRFGMFLMNGGELEGVRLLSPKTVEFMTSDHLMDTTTPSHTVALEGPGYGFGLGFGVRKADGGSWFAGTQGDYNWGGSHGHYFFADPVEGFMGVFMSYGNWNRGHVRQVFKNMAYAAIVEMLEYE